MAGYFQISAEIFWDSKNAAKSEDFAASRSDEFGTLLPGNPNAVHPPAVISPSAIISATIVGVASIAFAIALNERISEQLLVLPLAAER
jgi:hypothetical protein